MNISGDDAGRLTMSGLIRAVIRAELARVASAAVDAATLDPGAASSTGLGTKSQSLLRAVELEPRINREGWFREGLEDEIVYLSPLSWTFYFRTSRWRLSHSLLTDYMGSLEFDRWSV